MMKTYQIGLIGLGYVGFPLACLFAKKYPTRGYDPKKERVEALLKGVDHTGEISTEVIQERLSTHLQCSSNPDILEGCNVYIIGVPTPIDLYQQPDLRPLEIASQTVGKYLKEGAIVIYESTVYPGVTEEVCVPILAKASGLKYNESFFVGYSPERINPGDKAHTVENICKITSGSTPVIAQEIDWLYNTVLEGGTYPAGSIKIAEAAKVIENAQRDVNIAFMNEIAKIFNILEIDTQAVLAAAGSKWNFLPFRPGLVGGHCIGVDPYYLIQKAKLHGLSPRLMMESRKINDGMGGYIAQQVIKKMCKKGMQVKGARILLMGFTFKENCPDMRNTKVIDIYHALQEYSVEQTLYDPWVNSQEAKQAYEVQIETDFSQIKRKYQVIILCVAHQQFQSLPIQELLSEGGILYDVKGHFRDIATDGL